ncbi:MAG: septal ring lytic transglycosylase RlpA family protein [Ginsengibacter sp.]
MKITFMIFLLFLLSELHCYAQEIEKANIDSFQIESKCQNPNFKFGIASFYATKFHGGKTANGEKYDKGKYTAACNILPLNTWVKVTNLQNNKSVIVRINDRLHRKNKRLLDLSYAAAEKLDYIKRGISKIKMEVLKNFTPPKSVE